MILKNVFVIFVFSYVAIDVLRTALVFICLFFLSGLYTLVSVNLLRVVFKSSAIFYFVIYER